MEIHCFEVVFMTGQIHSVSKVGLWTRSFIFIMAANGLLFMAFEMLLPTLPLFVSSVGERLLKLAWSQGFSPFQLF